jgi:hypothetical protein
MDKIYQKAIKAINNVSFQKKKEWLFASKNYLSDVKGLCKEFNYDLYLREVHNAIALDPNLSIEQICEKHCSIPKEVDVNHKFSIKMVGFKMNKTINTVYHCDKCNIMLKVFATNDIVIDKKWFIMDYNLMSQDNLTCDEFMIKDIIE